jgi:LysM repeat protein
MRIVYLIVLILFTITNIYGQSAVKISTEKVKVGEKTYYAHTVQKKETLHSLSKAYNISIAEIIKNNESAASGLKAGSVLLIPIKTIAQDSKYHKHTVKWYEDITDISARYGVTVEQIMEVNDLKSSKLSPRQKLLIPISTQQTAEAAVLVAVKDTSKTATATATTANTVAAEITVADTTADYKEGITDKVRMRKFNEPVQIGYILPLGSADTNRINTNFMDFYAGSLLAINDMKQEGVPIGVNVYDQSEYEPLHRIIDSPDFSNNQLLIGPARAKVLTTFTGYSQNSMTPLVSPLDNTAETMAEGNPYFVQIPSNTISQISNTVELLNNYRIQDSVSTVMLICEKGNTSDSLIVNNTKRLLDEKGIEYKTISYGILEGRDIYSTMLACVDTLSTKPHIAIVPSNSEAFVSDVIRNLDLCQKPGAKVTVFGFPKWRNFETINIELFHQTNLHLSLPYYVDYSSSEVQDFLMKYRALYGAEPTPYAFQGYDITKFILKQMAIYGNSFIYCNELAPASLLQSDFLLRRDSERNGLKNTATRNIRYNPDYTVSVIR